MNAGAEVLIKFVGDTKDFGKEVGGVKEKISSIASGVAKGVAAATAVATTALVGLTKKAVDSFAEYEQLMGGVETLFGTGGMTVEEYAKKVGKSIEKVTDEYNKLDEAQEVVSVHAWEAYKTAGLSVNEYMSTVTSFAASLKQSIKDPVKLAEAADKAVIDMADNANKMGTSMESIQNAYQGFAKQNYTMLDNLKLGYGGTKTEMERLLADASKISKVKYDIKNLGDVYEAIHVIQTELGITGTTAKEASTTIQGSLNMTKSSFQNFLVSLADGTWEIDGAIDDLIESAMTFGENLMPVIEKVLENVAKAIPKFVDKIVAILPGLIQNILPSLIEGAVALVNGLIKALPMLITALMPSLIQGLIEITNQIIIMLPEIILMIADMIPTVLPMIIDAIMQVIPMLLNHLPEFLQAGVKILIGIVSGLISALPKILSFGVQFVSSLFNGIVGSIGKIPELIFGVFGNIGDGLKRIVEGITRMFKLAFEGIVNIIKTPINWIISGINAFIRALNKIKIPNWVPVVGGLGFNIKELPKLATGTNYVPEDTLAMIHEGEAVVPKKFNPYANGVNSQTMGAMQNSNIRPIINVYANFETDPLGQVVSNIKTFGGGAKGDYSYGMGVN